MVRSLHVTTTCLRMYKYLNLNPTRQHESDCVCRAIALATRTDYGVVKDMLYENGLDRDCDELNMDCYANLLADLGYVKQKAENKTVAQLAAENPKDILLVRISGHLTCCINGDCYDIWDCTEKPVDSYWVVE